MESGQDLDCPFRGLSDVGMQFFEEERSGNADAELARESIQMTGEIADRHVDARRIPRVVAREDLQQQGRVFDGVRQRADVVEGPGKGHHTAGAHAAVGGLDSDDTAEGSGFADRAASIGTDGGKAQPGGDAGGGASGRTSGHARGVPGVVYFAKETDHRAAAVGEFVQVLFAEDDRSGSAQAAHDFGVFLWNAIFELGASGGGPGAGGINKVFEPDRDAVEWAAVVTAVDFPLGAVRLIERGVGENGDEGVEFRVELLDVGEAIACHFDGGDGFLADFLAKLLDRGTHMSLDRSKRFYKLREEFIVSESNQPGVCENRAEGKLPQKLSTACRRWLLTLHSRS